MNKIRDALQYDRNRGALIWKKQCGFIRAGKTAGGMVNGAVYVTLDGVRYLAKDLVWYLCKGKWPDARLYHRNGDRSDIRLENLTYDRQRRGSARDYVDAGIRAGEYGYTVTVFLGGQATVVGTEPDLDKAMALLEGAVRCLE